MIAQVRAMITVVGVLQEDENASSQENDSSLRNNQVHCTSLFNGKIITRFTKLLRMVFPPIAEGPYYSAQILWKKEEAFHFNLLLKSVILSLAISSQKHILLGNKVLLYSLNISALTRIGWGRWRMGSFCILEVYESRIPEMEINTHKYIIWYHFCHLWN